MKTIKLLLSGKKGLDVLLHLVNIPRAIEQIHSVEVQPDKGAVCDYAEEIKQVWAKYHHRRRELPVEVPGYTIAIGWKRMIRDTENLIIIHDSLLPKYRGFAPTVAALINGDTEIGSTAFYAVDEVDAGPIILQYVQEITYPITIAEAIDLQGLLYVKMVDEIFTKVRNDVPLLNHDQVGEPSYSIWRDEEDYRIDWTWPAEKIRRFVDAVGYPYQGASAVIEGKKVRIHSCCELSSMNIVHSDTHIGKVFSINHGWPIVLCGEGLLQITEMGNDVIDGEDLLPWTKLKTRFK